MPYRATDDVNVEHLANPVPPRTREPAREAGLGEGHRPAAAAANARAHVRGKFIFVGEEKFYVRGVTYGPFRPEPDGCEYHDAATVDRDFRGMAGLGINAVRTYTVPPVWVLDAAARHGLKVMVGLPWEQHIAFLDDRGVAGAIERRVREAVRACAAHPAVLCFTVGNEIPTHIARWYGPKPIAAFLERLCRAVKREDPGALVTYANYPSTEYLDLPFLDFVSFNVYLESQSKLEPYLARLQNIAGERPLVIAEVGLDSLRNGEAAQARVLEWQVRTTFAAGCAGIFVFAWTDEWYRGGYEVTDWAFGVTTRGRAEKPAAGVLRQAFGEVPFPSGTPWPKVSVVICTYNGGRTIRQAVEGALALDYPDYEVIVVDDGSRDRVPQIVGEYGDAVRVIRTENRGLSAARNTGMRAAAGEVVAYLDDDAWPDRQWLKYLAATFLRTNHVGVGGPNVAPPDDGFRARCVAHAPGGPNHVLLTDAVAEHIPGCNMAFRKSALEAIGGFDEGFRIAGDDVDVCWRLQDARGTLGFSPAAMVWHRRRDSIRAYWRQQLNYGRAEAMLERKWPHKYNALGNPTWEGRLYGKGLLLALGWRHARIYHGTWGTALFQSVYHRAPGMFHALPTTPEWYLILAVLTLLLCWAPMWPPLVWVAPVLVLAGAIPAVQSVTSAHRSFRRTGGGPAGGLFRLRALTAWLHLIQPAARLSGKLRTGLTPWRQRGPGGFVLPAPRSLELWASAWHSLDDRLREIEAALVRNDAVVVRGGDFDDWDLEVRGGLVGSVRARMTVEEHGHGQQMVRLRAWPRCSVNAGLLALLLIFICDAAAVMAAWETWAVSGILLVLTLGVMLRELGGAMAAILHVTPGWGDRRRGRRGGRGAPAGGGAGGGGATDDGPGAGGEA
jgi:GT2 family glycosyltransferase